MLLVPHEIAVLEAELDRLRFIEDCARVSLNSCSSSEVFVMRLQLRAAEAAVRDCERELSNMMNKHLT